MCNQHRRYRHLRQQTAAAEFLPSDAGRPPPEQGDGQDAKPGVRPHATGYRYEQLGDALAHARQTRSGPDEDDGSGLSLQRPAFVPPTDAEQMLMASLGIQFDGRAFRFAGYRYDRLADAVLYARLAVGPA
jgi:hypothetical protein